MFMVIEFNIIPFSSDFFSRKPCPKRHTVTNITKVPSYKKVSFISTLFDFPFHWVFPLNICSFFSFSKRSLASFVSTCVPDINWEDFVAIADAWHFMDSHDIQFNFYNQKSSNVEFIYDFMWISSLRGTKKRSVHRKALECASNE